MATKARFKFLLCGLVIVGIITCIATMYQILEESNGSTGSRKVVFKNYEKYLIILKGLGSENAMLDLQAMKKLFEYEDFKKVNKSAKRVAIIIPYRDRAEQLAIFLSHMYPIFKRQQINFKIFIVQQTDGQPFNKGRIINAGFIEARKYDKFDCYFIHDVDILLEDERCLYCDEEDDVRHFSTQIDTFGYKEIKYYNKVCDENEIEQFDNVTIYGGIIRITEEAMLKTNGLSNIYWQWGAEDDDFYLRLRHSGINTRTSTTYSECRFTMLKHDQAKKSLVKDFLLTHGLSRQKYDGLNSLNYTILGYTETPFYVNITVDVGSPAMDLIKSIPRKISETTRCSVGDNWIKKNIFHINAEVNLFYFEIFYSRYLPVYFSLFFYAIICFVFLKLITRPNVKKMIRLKFKHFNTMLNF